MENDPLLEGLDVYIVGGAVRDALLGFEPGDRDWVVVGSTPEQLLDRGFIPIGADFPVFYIHRPKKSSHWHALNARPVEATRVSPFIPAMMYRF